MKVYSLDLSPRGFKWFMNLYPPYLFSGTRVKHIAADWRHIIVLLHKSFLTRNYVGTTFGGSMYAAADPFYMLMLIKIMGINNYIIWDKGASIDFRKPAKTHLTYDFEITDDDLAKIHAQLDESGKALPEFHVQGIDTAGDVCVSVRKILYVRKKR